MKKLLYLILFIPFASFSQDYGNKSEAIELCAAMQSNNFSSDTKAEKALDRILNVIGASKRFVLQPCDNINNAVATSLKGIRYILYDRDFMDSLDNGNNWGNLFILAHEVGHHINGHSLDIVLYAADVVEPKTLEQKRQQELEADKFAGFILAKLGGTISEANKIILKATTNDDDAYSTHPSQSKRLNAIKIGYDKGLGNKTTAYEAPTEVQTAEEYFYRALEKQNKKDYYGAVADYTKAIEINPNDANAYINRGNSKNNLEDYYGAIADYTKAIEITPNDAAAYYNRGFVKSNLKDNYGAIADYTKAIEINPNYADAYNNRGIAKEIIGDLNGACTDWKKAVELGVTRAAEWVKNQCN